MKWWQWLTDSSVFMPRYSCGPGWTSSLVWWQQTSNLAIFAAYFAIPVALGLLFFNLARYSQVPKGLWFGVIFLLSFIATCGATHLMDYLMFIKPMYRLDTLIRIACAVASWAFIGWVAWGVFNQRVVNWRISDE